MGFITYGIEQSDLVVMRQRVKSGAWSFGEAMRTLKASYNLAKNAF